MVNYISALVFVILLLVGGGVVAPLTTINPVLAGPRSQEQVELLNPEPPTLSERSPHERRSKAWICRRG